jgi:hypothetical protein
MYEITDYSYKQAKRLGVEIKPSTNKKKKIDVFKDAKRIASIGAIGYGDYSTFIKTDGKDYADKRRVLYKLRHKKDKDIIGSNGYFASEILW